LNSPEFDKNSKSKLISLRYFLLQVNLESKKGIVYNTSEILSDEYIYDDSFR